MFRRWKVSMIDASLVSVDWGWSSLVPFLDMESSGMSTQWLSWWLNLIFFSGLIVASAYLISRTMERRSKHGNELNITILWMRWYLLGLEQLPLPNTYNLFYTWICTQKSILLVTKNTKERKSSMFPRVTYARSTLESLLSSLRSISSSLSNVRNVHSSTDTTAAFRLLSWTPFKTGHSLDIFHSFSAREGTRKGTC